MTRAIHPALLSNLAAEEFTLAYLLEAQFSTTVRLTDAPRNITAMGYEFTASVFLGFDGITETSEVVGNQVTITLSGVSQDVVALLLAESYLMRRVRIWAASLSDELTVVGAPLLIFDGLMDRPTIVTDVNEGTCIASVECVNIWSAMDQQRGRKTNDAQQQFLYPGDRAFEPVASFPDEVFWGAPSRVSATERIPNRFLGKVRR